ncbi:hypothetical protein ILUMI_05061 [Ignelater luminosus]|uniref:Peptidase aspartic putative domain-containing protein n=1 Tax=Ignelater luminosus TaxID=2038154 RepID=A0A8K0GDY3_IGNLU|nr:hypothetical protein ILUMI_05061 [Ignelater luminosus]
MPDFKASTNNLEIPKGLKLADQYFYNPTTIDILLGAEIFWELLSVGQVRLGSYKPVSQKTKLGWVIGGPVERAFNGEPTTSLVASVKPVDDKKKVQKRKSTPAEWKRAKQKRLRGVPAEENRGRDRKMQLYSEDGSRPVKKSYFRHMFNTCYNLGFGNLRTDVCSTCLQLSEKLKRCKDESLKPTPITKRNVHKMRAKVYFRLLSKAEEEVKLCSFDCPKYQTSKPTTLDKYTRTIPLLYEAHLKPSLIAPLLYVVARPKMSSLKNPAKRMIITKGNNGIISVRGENAYNTDLGRSKSITKRGKDLGAIKPRVIPKQNVLNLKKKTDVRELMRQHYGEDWNNDLDLSFYQYVLKKST